MKNEKGVRSGRLAYIDWLKTLALCLMLVFHCTLYPVNLGLGSSPLEFARMYGRGLMSMCVPLFFTVNGYLLLGGSPDLGKHIRRTGRMLLTMVFWILFLLLVLQPLRGEYYTWVETRQRFWTLQMDWNNHLWYLSVLVGIYFFFPLLKQCYDSNRPAFYWFFGVCWALVFGNALINEFLTVFNRVVRNETIVYIKYHFFSHADPFAGNVGMGMVYFCMGGILRILQEKILGVPKWKRRTLAGLGLLVSSMLLLVLCYGYSILSKKTWDIVWYGYTTVFTQFNVVCLFVLTLEIRSSNWLVRAISANTLGIYLMHVIAQVLMGKWFAGIPAMQSFWGSCVYAAAVLFACLPVCLVIKKIPVLRKLI